MQISVIRFPHLQHCPISIPRYLFIKYNLRCSQNTTSSDNFMVSKIEKALNELRADMQEKHIRLSGLPTHVIQENLRLHA